MGGTLPPVLGFWPELHPLHFYVEVLAPRDFVAVFGNRAFRAAINVE